MLERLHFEPSEHSRPLPVLSKAWADGRLPGSALATQQIRKPTVCIAAHDTMHNRPTSAARDVEEVQSVEVDVLPGGATVAMHEFVRARREAHYPSCDPH